MLGFVSALTKIVNELAAVPPGLEFMKLAVGFLLYCLVLAIIICAIDRVIVKQVVSRRRMFAGMPASAEPSLVSSVTTWFKAVRQRRAEARARRPESPSAAIKHSAS